MALPTAELGVFGGSGFYSFLDGVTVAFLPRHGRRHQYPPHRINYRANLWAMKELGVTRVVGPCAAGSLQPEAAPGHFVVCDQVVDRTWGRADTFYDGPETTHISSADPYCPELRALAVKKAEEHAITAHDGGTMVVIQGPRFSTRAESRWFQQAGWTVINMTGYPEALLARELEICYVNVSLITDYDVGLEGMPGVAPVSNAEVVRVFEENNAKLRDLLFSLLPAVPGEAARGARRAGGGGRRPARSRPGSARYCSPSSRASSPRAAPSPRRPLTRTSAPCWSPPATWQPGRSPPPTTCGRPACRPRRCPPTRLPRPRHPARPWPSRCARATCSPGGVSEPARQCPGCAGTP